MPVLEILIMVAAYAWSISAAVCVECAVLDPRNTWGGNGMRLVLRCLCPVLNTIVAWRHIEYCWRNQ